MTVLSGVVVGVLALVAVAAALATRVPSLERPVRVAVVAVEALLAFLVVADLGVVLGADDADRPTSMLTHVGYAVAADGLVPLLVFRRPPVDDPDAEVEPASLWVVVITLVAVAGASSDWPRPDERPGSTGRQVLVAVYAVFAVAAGARSVVQLTTGFSAAPLAYSLSAVAAAVYVVATLALRRTSERAWRVAVAACAVEAVGVVVVGSLSLARPELFPDQTVWSDYGIGYGFVPLVLPFVGLWWLLRVRASHHLPG